MTKGNMLRRGMEDRGLCFFPWTLSSLTLLLSLFFLPSMPSVLRHVVPSLPVDVRLCCGCAFINHRTDFVTQVSPWDDGTNVTREPGRL